ncbi:MAG: DUF1848 domain-containing protein [Clostridiales bacterium]|nr:DUF1848 domain-containing protein [Clostridiales bacterium]
MIAVIVSASRRTDIPAFYSEWFLRRVRAGFVKTRNPFRPSQERVVPLDPASVDCLVFWTKDPLPLMAGLEELERRGFCFYFQFTLTPYGPALEPGLRPKAALVETFQALSRRLGRERVRWRYDPILLGRAVDMDFHRRAFERLCDRLADWTEGVTVSFVDLYSKRPDGRFRALTEAEMWAHAELIADIAGRYGLPVTACCEAMDLSPLGIGRAACVDGALVERLSGRPVAAKPDKNQRPGCGCVQSVDIGAYDSCGNGCVYCYARHSAQLAARNRARHDPDGPFLLP